MTDAAQKIAARVPLPEPEYEISEYEILFAGGSSEPLYTAAQMEALRLAAVEEALRLAQLPRYRISESGDVSMIECEKCNQEALRGAEAVASVSVCTRSENGVWVTWAAGDVQLSPGTKLYTAQPAGSVEVTDAMVERAMSKLPGPPPPESDWAEGFADAIQLVREEMPAALTAALRM